MLTIRNLAPCVFASYTLNISAPPSDKHLLVDPHECARVVGFAFVLDAVEAVSPLAVVPLVVVVELHLPHGFKHPHLSELYADLNWLPLSTLGVCHPLCVILAGVDHRLRVFRLLLQGKGHPTYTHRRGFDRSGSNDHLDFVLRPRQQLDGPGLSEPGAVRFEVHRAVVGKHLQGNPDFDDLRDVGHVSIWLVCHQDWWGW